MRQNHYLQNAHKKIPGLLHRLSLFAFEVTSTLRRLIYLNEITDSEGEAAFQKFLQIPVGLSHRQAIFPMSWKLAQELKHSRTYDTAYLALAQLRKCDFWTADERLFNGIKDRFPWVKWIGNYQHFFYDC